MAVPTQAPFLPEMVDWRGWRTSRPVTMARDRRLDRIDDLRRLRGRAAFVTVVSELAVPGKPAYEASQRTLKTLGAGDRSPSTVVFHSSSATSVRARRCVRRWRGW